MELHGSELVKENSIAGLCTGSGKPQNSRVRFTLVAEPQNKGHRTSLEIKLLGVEAGFLSVRCI